MDTVTERISTVEDGPGTVNERLSPGGPGPEGQPDTAHEILSGSQPEAVGSQSEEIVGEHDITKSDVKPARKRATKRA